MNVIEIKIVKTGTEDVVYHGISITEERWEDVAAVTAEIIEEITNSPIDEDDRRDIINFSLTSKLNSRFGAEWEFYVEAIATSFHELDIDEEFDNAHQKYQLCL